jgi:hypothetical protein
MRTSSRSIVIDGSPVPNQQHRFALGADHRAPDLPVLYTLLVTRSARSRRPATLGQCSMDRCPPASIVVDFRGPAAWLRRRPSRSHRRGVELETAQDTFSFTISFVGTCFGWNWHQISYSPGLSVSGICVSTFKVLCRYTRPLIPSGSMAIP